ncbi:MAG: hypothetical protein ACH349_01580 [Candidatus Rhabdochlamydia sp.]
MSIPFDLQQVAVKVFSLLTDCPEARDDDRLLLAEIWIREKKSTDLNGFFQELLDGSLSHPESIRRMRQKLQEKHPSLRGDKYDTRHGMEASMCQQLTFFDLW